jgi:beta-lactamase class A
VDTNKKKYLIRIHLLFFSGLLGFFIYPHVYPQKFNLIEQRNSQNYQFINPLLDCNVSDITNNNLSSLELKYQEIIRQFKTSSNITYAAIYYRDLNNGPWIGVNQDEMYSPASLIKVPLLITYLKLAESKSSLLDEKIKYIPQNQKEIPDIPPSLTLTAENEYTIRELLERMIVYSDNDAFYTLTNYIKSELVAKTYSDLDIKIDPSVNNNPSGNIITVKNYASFFRILFNASYLSPDMSELALQLLSKIEFKNGLNASLPREIKISHKYGERYYVESGERQLHDCGIIYLPEKPYLLCVMTRGKNFDDLSTFIKKISDTTYTYLNQN